MALLYSARLRRCMAGRPGFGFAAASRSRASSSHLANADAAAGVGRGSPGGGISPVCDFAENLFESGGTPPGWDQSMPSRTIPAVLALCYDTPRNIAV